MLTLNVYTLNEDAWSVDQLIRLWRAASGDGQEVLFDFTGCGFLRQNAVAFLGGLARLIEYRGGRVTFVWDTLGDAVKANLCQNGFMSTFGGELGPWRGNSIPFREDKQQEIEPDDCGFRRRYSIKRKIVPRRENSAGKITGVKVHGVGVSARNQHAARRARHRSEEHTSELQSLRH